MKYPIGIQTFEQIIDNGFVYVDKTDLVYKLATEGKIYFLSRPRRFGKSLLLSTLKCYFEGRKELFKGLKIDALETEWKQHPIFHIDFNGYNFLGVDNLMEVLDGYVSDWETLWGRAPHRNTLGDRFAYVLHQAHVKTGQLAVVLIDEYDKPLLDVLDTGLKIKSGENDVLIEDYNRNVLKAFYSVFKLADADLRFVMLTGVTKFSQVGFSQADDISMSAEYESLCGFTVKELTDVFALSIHEMAMTLGYSPKKMLKLLKTHYDGYHFGPRLTDIYNPFCILNALSQKKLGVYRLLNNTSSNCIRLLENIHGDRTEMLHKYYVPSQFIDHYRDIEKTLPLIYQNGYLTIKGIKRIGMRIIYQLGYPNAEVAEEFHSLLASRVFSSKTGTVSDFKVVGCQ